MMLRRYLVVLGSLLMLGACSSTAMQYHTLIPARPATASTDNPAGFQLQLMPVRIPVQIDQPSLVIRNNDGRLSMLESALWASPPADEIHNALAFELENRLGVRDLSGLPGRPGEPVLTVRTDVRRFDSLPGTRAVLDVVWNIGFSHLPDQQRSLTCASTITEPAGLELDTLVLAHQRAISRLADEINGTARSWFSGGVANCP